MFHVIVFVCKISCFDSAIVPQSRTQDNGGKCCSLNLKSLHFVINWIKYNWICLVKFQHKSFLSVFWQTYRSVASVTVSTHDLNGIASHLGERILETERDGHIFFLSSNFALFRIFIYSPLPLHPFDLWYLWCVLHLAQSIEGLTSPFRGHNPPPPS